MNSPIADRAQRDRAVEPDASYIVKAPAGSGKTGLLIRRYLRLLQGVAHPEEIVAVTFTIKAAAEMRDRIVTALEGAATGASPQDEHAAAIQELARRALARDAELGWDLLNNPGRLRIQTIDALCAHLTRHMPMLARFGAQPETLEDCGACYREAALATLEELEGGEFSEPVAVLLAHLDNDLRRARDLLADTLARRDQWLRHVVGARREALEGALRRLVESTLVAARAAIPADAVVELTALLRYAAAHLERDGSGSAIRGCAGMRELPGPDADQLNLWKGIEGFLLAQSGDWRRKGNVSLGFPPPGRGGAEAELRRETKDRYEALLARLSGNEALRLQLEETRYLPVPAYSVDHWQVIEALCRLLIVADAKLRILFARHNLMDFAGIAMAAADALGGDQEPTDLALHLDYRIRHVLVDEFQDISINQYELLRRLTAGWAPGDGHTLFLVGDPMQSIYRFREAEVGLFVDTWNQRRLAQVPLVPLEISVNFRSTRGIVDWVNRTFVRVLPRTADAARGAVTYAPAEAFHAEREGEPVLLHALAVRDPAREAGIVRDLILAARRQSPEGNVAILVRNRSLLTHIIARLQRDGLRFRAVEIEGLGHRPAIQDLLALTRALHHLADRVAWLAILRAPWCGLTLADLLALCGEAEQGSVWERILDRDRVAAMSADGQLRLARFRDSLAPVMAQRGRWTLRRWIESAWLALGGPATLPEPTDLVNVQTYFDLLEEFDAGGDLLDAVRFDARVKALFAAPDVEADDRLQVMTIHRAKGLEFDTVIVPGLERSPRGDPPRLLLWSERPGADGGQDLLLAPIREAGSDVSPIYECIRRLLDEKAGYEEGRLLYVAATRARYRLHLIGSVNVKPDGIAAPRSGSLLAQLWPAVREEFERRLAGAAETPPDYAAEPGMGQRRLGRLPLEWRAPAAPAPVMLPAEFLLTAPGPQPAIEFEWAGETVRHIGTAYHQCLQWWGRLGEAAAPTSSPGDRAALRHLLEQLGTPQADLEWAVGELARAVANTQEDERGLWLFAGTHRDARGEVALSGMHGGRLVNVKIDRTFVDADGRRWIVDYKTSRHEGADVEAFLDRERERYRAQLERYADLMRAIDPRPIRLGLYFPLLRGWREWPY